MGPDQVLAGNIDPGEDLAQRHAGVGGRGDCRNAIAEAGPRYIIAAGCEVPRDTPPENVRALRDYARAAGGVVRR